MLDPSLQMTRGAIGVLSYRKALRQAPMSRGVPIADDAIPPGLSQSQVHSASTIRDTASRWSVDPTKLYATRDLW